MPLSNLGLTQNVHTMSGKSLFSAQSLREAILAQSPRVGRPVEDMDPEYREKLIDFGNSGYVVLYRLDGETVALLAVRHQKEAGYP